MPNRWKIRLVTSNPCGSEFHWIHASVYRRQGDRVCLTEKNGVYIQSRYPCHQCKWCNNLWTIIQSPEPGEFGFLHGEYFMSLDSCEYLLEFNAEELWEHKLVSVFKKCFITGHWSIFDGSTGQQGKANGRASWYLSGSDSYCQSPGLVIGSLNALLSSEGRWNYKRWPCLWSIFLPVFDLCGGIESISLVGQ